MTRKELVKQIWELHAKARAAYGQVQISPSELLKARMAGMPMHALHDIKRIYERLLEPEQ